MKVIYPVFFYEEEDGKYSVFVPDFAKALSSSASTSGDNLEEAMDMAQDLIAGLVLDSIEENDKIPVASKIEEISFDEFEKWLDIKDWNYVSRFKTYISVDIGVYSKKWSRELIKKTVNIPKWVNTKAEDLHINFSKTLEEALLEKIYKK